MDRGMPSVAFDELPEIDANEFIKTVETRRSVRRFTSEPVPEDVVNKCLDLAMLAPNSCNLQPWEFYRIKSDDVKQKVVHACFSQNAAKTSQELIAIVARTKTWRKHCDDQLEHWPDPETPKVIKTFYKRVAPFLYTQGPLSIFGHGRRLMNLFIGLKRPVPRGPNSNAEMKLWAVKSTALASQNLMLAFRAHGYDTCPMEGFDENRANKILKLPRDAYIVMFLAVGKRAENGIYNSRLRFPREQFIKTV